MNWVLRGARLARSLLWVVLLFFPFSEAKQWLEGLEPLFAKECVLQHPCAQAAQASFIAEHLGLSGATAALSRSEHLVLSPLGLLVEPNKTSLGYPLELSKGSPRGPPGRGQGTQDRDSWRRQPVNLFTALCPLSSAPSLILRPSNQ